MPRRAKDSLLAGDGRFHELGGNTVDFVSRKGGSGVCGITRVFFLEARRGGFQQIFFGGKARRVSTELLGGLCS